MTPMESECLIEIAQSLTKILNVLELNYNYQIRAHNKSAKNHETILREQIKLFDEETNKENL